MREENEKAMQERDLLQEQVQTLEGRLSLLSKSQHEGKLSKVHACVPPMDQSDVKEPEANADEHFQTLQAAAEKLKCEVASLKRDKDQAESVFQEAFNKLRSLGYVM